MQKLPTLLQSIILPCLQFRFGDLFDLVAEGFHAAELFTLVHGHAVDLPPQCGHRFIGRPIAFPQSCVVCKIIQKTQVVLFIKQRRRIVLAVDIDQLDAKFPKDGNGYQRAIHATHILTIEIDLPLNDGFSIVLHIIFAKPGKLRHIGKYRPYGCLIGSGADHIPVSTLTQNGGNSINDDRFACTCFTGQNIKSFIKGNV